MPYVKTENQKALVKQEMDPQDTGDLNAFISLELKRRWINNYGYRAGIEPLCAEFVIEPERNEFLRDFHRSHQMFSWTQIKTASFLAYMEFMRRIGDPYEDQMIQKNGDLIYGDVVQTPKKAK